MATVEKTILSPSAASGLVDESFNALDAKLPFSNVLPVVSNNGEKTVRWTPYIPAPATDAMTVRAWDAEAGYLKTTEQAGEKFAGLLPMSKKAHVSERDLIGRSGDTAFLRTKLAEHFDQLGREAAVKVELLRINAMVNAKIVLNENGVNATYDFERPTALNDVTPSKNWNVSAATPLKDIKKWVKLITDNHGRTPSAVLTTSAVIEALSTNEEIITAYTGQSAANSPSFISPDAVKQVLASYAGLTSVQEIDLMYTQLERDNGILLPVAVNSLIPDKTFLMFSSFNDTTLGFTASGPTVEADDPEYGINRADNYGMIGLVMAEAAPTRYDVWVNGSYMPILQQAVSTFKANVL